MKPRPSSALLCLLALAAGAARSQAPAPHPPIAVPFTLAKAGLVTLVIEDAHGRRVRNLVSETPYPAGRNTAYWDGLDDVGRTQMSANNTFAVAGKPVAPGTYRVRGLVHPPIDLRYQFTVYNPGQPPWATSDPSSEWLANHTPPSGVLFVPAEDAKLGPAPSPTGGEVLVCSAVTEGGSGLAWLDLNGRKLRGQVWVGGVWTGATNLARDGGAKRVGGVYAYAGSAWAGGGYDGDKPELRLAELLTRDSAATAPRDGRMGRGDDRPLLTPHAPYSGLLPAGQDKLQKGGADYRYTFPDNAHVGLSGLAVRDGFLVASLPRMGRLLWVDARARKVLGTVPLPDPRGVAFDAQGRLLVLSGTRLLRYILGADRWKMPAPTVLVAGGLQDPRNLALDAAGNIYISDRGASNQIKVFSAAGAFLRALGRPGRPKLGAYDPRLMHQPDGVTVDGLGRVWVAETDFVPKRVSVWDAKTGGLIRAFYGPMEYGGGGALDPADRTRFFYSGLEFALDWRNGSSRPVANYYQSKSDALGLPAPFDFKSRAPETAIHFAGREYLTDCYNVSPTNAADSAALWRLENGVARPVAAMGDAGGWPLVSGLFRGLGSYSVRWTGQVRPAASGAYTFSTLSDDGIRLWVNGTPLVNDWAGHGPTEDAGTITLQAGKRYDLRLEYYQGGGGAAARLSWSAPGLPRQVIPAARLYPTALAARPGGLTGRYYNGTDLKDLAGTRLDPAVDFNWDAAPPAALTKSGAAFRSRLPAGYHAGDSAAFVWSDLNGNGRVEPEEVTFVKGHVSGITVMPDLSFVAAYLDGKAIRLKPASVTARGVPRYDLTAGQVLAEGTRTPQTSGGGQALVGGDGWTVLTVPPAPYAAQASMAGVKDGVPLWTYPSLWPGLHPSHDAPLPDHPGELIGTTRLLGGLVRPEGSDAGELWAVNGNKGNVYLLTTDGLFVATLFRDSRLRGWDAPRAVRDMRVGDLSLQEENFWPSLTQTAGGAIYLVGGGDGGNILRVDGLSGIQRLPDATLTVTPAQSQQSPPDAVQAGGAEPPPLSVARRPDAPAVDGKLTDWPGSAFVPIDARASAALSVSGDHLYAAFRTGDADLLRNAGGDLPLLFKTGGALDIELDAVPGGERLLVCRVGGKTTAALYRPRAPGTGTPPVAFSSPQRTVRFDRVDDVSSQVGLAGADGDYEISVPLSLLGLTPTAGQTLHGDIGLLRGNGFQTLQRVYWHNKATGLVSDVPSEAELTPTLWGAWTFK